MRRIPEAARRPFRAFFMALGMFTAIPCPYSPWDDGARELMLVALPAVGAVIGLLWAALSWIGNTYLPAIGSALIVALPWLLTGFIHLDGYMDTCDALLSWRPLEKRLEILKDSHTGAFAVVGMVLLALIGYDAAATVGAKAGFDLRTLIFIPIVSRCGSAFCVLTLRPIGHSEYAGMEGRMRHRLAVVVIWLLTIIICANWLGDRVIPLLVETVAYAAAMAWANRACKGVSGDLAGFALTVSECAALVALASVH